VPKSKPPRKKYQPKPREDRAPTGFGIPVEWEHFLQSNPKRTRAIQNLLDTCHKVFIRGGATDQPAVRMGFYLGRICVEEFNEILLLAGNGYGVGALKILRSMYERAVTSAYLLNNVDKGDLFMDFHFVHRYKAYNHLKKISNVAKQPTQEMIDQIKSDYERVKDQYLEEICKTCQKKRPQPSWTKLDTASMAGLVGKGYAELYYDAFYQPTLQTHTTVASVLTRLKQKADGSIGFDEGPQREHAKNAVILAHNILLRIVDTQNKHFKLGLDTEIEQRAKEFLEAYAHREDASKKGK